MSIEPARSWHSVGYTVRAVLIILGGGIVLLVLVAIIDNLPKPKPPASALVTVNHWLCNVTPFHVSAAMVDKVHAYGAAPYWHAHGWFTLAPGSCSEEGYGHSGDTLYYTANLQATSPKAFSWNGNQEICVSTTHAFDLKASDLASFCAKERESIKFVAAELGDGGDIDLTHPDYPNLTRPAARIAGTKLLLQKAGFYKPENAPLGEKTDRFRSSLAAFAKEAGLPASTALTPAMLERLRTRALAQPPAAEPREARAVRVASAPVSEEPEGQPAAVVPPTPRAPTDSQSICNLTSYWMYLAVGYEPPGSSGPPEVRGWYFTRPGQCLKFPRRTGTPFYVNAQNDSKLYFGVGRWDGGFPLCARAGEAFEMPFVTDQGRCRAYPNGWMHSFQQIPAEKCCVYFYFDHTQSPTEAGAARRGAKRLLDVLGYEVGSIEDPSENSSFRASLSAYRRSKGLGTSDQVDHATLDALRGDAIPALAQREVAQADALLAEDRRRDDEDRRRYEEKNAPRERLPDRLMRENIERLNQNAREAYDDATALRAEREAAAREESSTSGGHGEASARQKPTAVNCIEVVPKTGLNTSTMTNICNYPVLVSYYHDAGCSGGCATVVRANSTAHWAHWDKPVDRNMRWAACRDTDFVTAAGGGSWKGSGQWYCR